MSLLVSLFFLVINFIVTNSSTAQPIYACFNYYQRLSKGWWEYYKGKAWHAWSHWCKFVFALGIQNYNDISISIYSCFFVLIIQSLKYDKNIAQCYREMKPGEYGSLGQPLEGSNLWYMYPFAKLTNFIWQFNGFVVIVRPLHLDFILFCILFLSLFFFLLIWLWIFLH